MGRRTALPAVAVLAVVLAGCGGGGSGTSTPAAGGTGSTPPSRGSSSAETRSGSTATVVDGVRLTAQGSQLKVGDTARVSWRPDQKTLGVISLTVTKLQKVPIRTFSDWRLDRATQASTPYFVHADVRNLGRSDLSGKAVPLYLLDEDNTLLQASTFQARFAACPSRPLPQGFTRHKKTSVCLVYFAPHHGRLVAISFRPTEQFQAITWKGTVHTGAGTHHHTKRH